MCVSSNIGLHITCHSYNFASEFTLSKFLCDINSSKQPNRVDLVI